MKITTIPNVYRNVNRWGEILTILSKYGLADWVSRFDLPLVKGFLEESRGERLAHLSRETRIRMAIEELGPTFIKLGQILSTRPDQVGMPLAQELQKLQTNVACDEPQVVRETIESELEQSLEMLFADFDTTPLASASIGQAHRARLHGGDDVVVKVQHAGIRRRMEVDLDILAGLAQLGREAAGTPIVSAAGDGGRVSADRAPRVRFRARSPQPAAVRAELRPLAARADSAALPAAFDRRVMTMEWLDGARLCDPALRQMPNIDLGQVTRHGAEMYLEMIFHHGFYHGDPHPGNLVVLPDGAIGLLDFGMVARLDEQLREEIEDMLIAIVSQDSQQLTSLVMRLGSVPPGLDEPALSVDLAEFVNHYANQPVEAFDLAGALSEMIEIVQRYRIALPPSICDADQSAGDARRHGPHAAAQLQPDGVDRAVSEEDAAATAIARAANAQGAADLFRGREAGGDLAAAAARYSAAGRKRQVRRPPRSPRIGAVGESAWCWGC